MSESLATQDEIAKVRRLGCHREGHHVEDIMVCQSRYPISYICSRCGKQWQAPDPTETESLAEQLCEAARGWLMNRSQIVEPGWEALRDDVKEPFRELALKLTYGWAGIGE